MKRVWAILIYVVVAVLVIAGCTWTFIHFTSKPVELPNVESGDKISGDVSGDVNGENEEISTEPIFTKDNYPRIDASLAIQPLTEAIKENFVGSGEAEKIETEYLNTHDVCVGVVDGTRDLCFMSNPSDEDIYYGKIKNWKEVGGEDAEIIAYQRPANSGSQSGMLQLVMKDTPLMTPPTMELTVGMGDLVDAVAQYDNSRFAIGYSYYYFVNTMYKRDTIKMLGINGIEANVENIKSNKYPIMTSGWFVFRKDEPENSLTRQWIKAVKSSRGAQIIENEGYVPAN